MVIAGCQPSGTSAERHVYYGNYREALVRVVADWEQPDTRELAEQFLDKHGRTMMRALNQQLDRASRQTFVMDYLSECQAIVPIMTRLPQSVLDPYSFPQRQQCADAQVTAVTQWRQSIQIETDPLRALAIWGHIQKYDTLSLADTKAIEQLNQSVTHAIQLTWVWAAPLAIDDVKATDWMPRIQAGMAEAVMGHLHASDTPYYRQVVTADYRIQVMARMAQTDTMTEPVWAYDELRFSKTDHGVTRWYTHDFQYRTYDRQYIIQAIAQVDVYYRGALIAQIPIKEQVSQTRELGDPTLDFPINYRDIQFPAAYKFRVNARMAVNSEGLIQQLSEQVYAAVASAINEALF